LLLLAGLRTPEYFNRSWPHIIARKLRSMYHASKLMAYPKLSQLAACTIALAHSRAVANSTDVKTKIGITLSFLNGIE
jgi:hypothetical protein